MAEVKLLIFKICGLGILRPGFENVRHCVSFYVFVLLFVVGCCVLSVHLMNPDYFEKAI